MSDTDKPENSTPTAQPQPEAASPPAESPLVEPGVRLRHLDKDLDREVEAAMDGMSDAELYPEAEQPPRKKAPTADQGRKKGKVIRVHGQDVFVEIPGGRSQGVLPVIHFPQGAPPLGTEIEVHIEGYDQANGLLILSRKGMAVRADWSSVAVDMVVEARVTATNKGGLSVDVNGIRGFMPISQIDRFRVENPEEFINQKLLCVITEVDPAERNLVVSRRNLLERERAEAEEKKWQDLKEGQVIEGVVRSLKEFGAFIDLGGLDGLLHISEMSWQRVENPAAVVQLGQSVKVVVLKIDREKRKISLGLKQLQPSPWESIADRFPPNTVVKGKVTRLMDFGAFVELEPGVEGMIHISELSPQRVRRVADVVNRGDEVQVMVLSIDPAQKRMSLSLKAALPEAAPEPDEDDTGEPRPERVRTTPLRGGIGSE